MITLRSLATEILSLFSLLKTIPFLICNLLFLLISIFVYKKTNSKFWHIDLKLFFKRFFNTLKLDKTLFILFLGLIVGANVIVKDRNFSESENRMLTTKPNFSIDKLLN